MWTVLFPSVGVRFRQWVNLERVYFSCWRGQIWERCAFVDFDCSNVVVQPPCKLQRRCGREKVHWTVVLAFMKSRACNRGEASKTANCFFFRMRFQYDSDYGAQDLKLKDLLPVFYHRLCVSENAVAKKLVARCLCCSIALAHHAGMTKARSRKQPSSSEFCTLELSGCPRRHHSHAQASALRRQFDQA